MVTFVDRTVLHAVSGAGGHGCASVHREKFKPLGGPDGGNGGRGGDVILEVDPSTTSLLDVARRPHRTGANGAPGQGKNKSGADGDDVIVAVPDGTVLSTSSGVVVADLVGAGARHVVARGGCGGLGNASLASARRKAPGFALLGETGMRSDIVLELKMLADVGLVGFPSAGKSSLVSVLSAARPKIADYPFTTLVPNLGVVKVDTTVFTVADVPGLIPGASEGKGLGLEFLRHIERCAGLVHVIDCATLESGRDPLADLDIIEAELAQYGGLTDRPRLVALNKIDVPDAAELAAMITPLLTERGLAVFGISAVTRQGLDELRYAMAAMVAAVRAERERLDPGSPRLVIRPLPVDDSGFTVTQEGDSFVVCGSRPERWVRQTDFTNEEAVGYLADRLARLGVEAELVRLGATAGAGVIIGRDEDAVVFDWQPSIDAGHGHVTGRRGTDERLEDW